MRKWLRRLLRIQQTPPVDLSKLTPLFQITDDAAWVVQIGSDGDVVLNRFSHTGKPDDVFTPISIWDAP